MPQADADKWNAKWSDHRRNGEATEQPPHPLVLRAADLLPSGRALDVACGLGRHTLALAARGWHVTAIDVSAIALQRLTAIADESARRLIETVRADLAAQEFVFSPASYDLIVMTNYLQRDLFATLQQALRVGGLFVAVIALLDDDPQLKPMNPAFLLQPGELVRTFADWELLHSREGKPDNAPHRRPVAEIIARRLPMRSGLGSSPVQ